ncbi:hypothetical protein BDV26DRAFT_261288 [Aspergillus bertholletiae]|uniref:Uncharacterized protein n=1 Tax=Aspergillus bertholletiae TaxID=1226010 RepID=A0A5N7BA57_9EURO|nr:hypothetical protein BDV26DRAFT_261288 [Aspergillus bertholletiae]
MLSTAQVFGKRKAKKKRNKKTPPEKRHFLSMTLYISGLIMALSYLFPCALCC